MRNGQVVVTRVETNRAARDEKSGAARGERIKLERVASTGLEPVRELPPSGF